MKKERRIEPDRLSPAVESALSACGRDRVMHNDGKPRAVAIRWRWYESPDDSSPQDRWEYAEGDSHDTAGRDAAAAFADRLQREGERLLAWSNRIRDALAAHGE